MRYENRHVSFFHDGTRHPAKDIFGNGTGPLGPHDKEGMGIGARSLQ